MARDLDPTLFQFSWVIKSKSVFFNINILSYQFYYAQAQKAFAKSDDIKIRYYDSSQFFQNPDSKEKVVPLGTPFLS